MEAYGYANVSLHIKAHSSKVVMFSLAGKKSSSKSNIQLMVLLLSKIKHFC